MTQHQDLLRGTLRRIFEDSSDSLIEPDFQRPSQLWTALVGAGMAWIGIDERYGGSGGSFSDCATLAFEAGRFAGYAPLPETSFLAGWITSKAQLPCTQDAETAVAVEAGALTIIKDGADLVVNGSIPEVPWACVARRVLVVYDAPDGQLLLALSADDFLLERGANLAGEPRDSLFLNNARISADRWRPSAVSLQDVRLRGALMRTFSMAGAMTSLMELTIKYAKDREQFGRPLVKLQAVQQLLAILAAQVYSAVIASRAALDATDTDEGMLKTLSAIVTTQKSALNAARLAHQIHGAIGVTMEYPLQRFTTRLWSWRDEYGGEAQWSREIASILRQHVGTDQLWPFITQTTFDRRNNR